MRAYFWFAFLLASGVGTAGQAQSERPLGQVDPAADLLLARPFVLQNPYAYAMSKEPFEVRSGILLVVEADPELLRPREVGMPVLYAGRLPVEIANAGYSDGRLVGILPAEIDLRRSPIFFGSSELPERVDRRRGEQELAAARAKGIRPFGEEIVRAALARGGDTLRVEGVDGLYLALSDLILAYAPADSDWARSYRLVRE